MHPIHFSGTLVIAKANLDRNAASRKIRDSLLNLADYTRGNEENHIGFVFRTNNAQKEKVALEALLKGSIPFHRSTKTSNLPPLSELVQKEMSFAAQKPFKLTAIA